MQLQPPCHRAQRATCNRPLPPKHTHVQLVDPKTGAEAPVTISQDDGIRGSTTLESLAGLATVFKKNGGTTTAGNSSQVRVCGGGAY